MIILMILTILIIVFCANAANKRAADKLENNKNMKKEEIIEPVVSPLTYERFHHKIRTVHDELIRPSRYRGYINHCWRCRAPVSSYSNYQCPECGWYVCTKCGSCAEGCGYLLHALMLNESKDDELKFMWDRIKDDVIKLRNKPDLKPVMNFV